ncbi:MAG: hypothetical protein NVS9B4_00400 [Candidatus Acidiferrum sp.]
MTFVNGDGSEHTLTREDFDEILFPKLRNGQRWGFWTLHAPTMELRLDFGEIQYDIPLGSIHHSETLMSWVRQIVEKTWATDEVIGGLVRALYEIYHPSFSGDHRVTPLPVRQ